MVSYDPNSSCVKLSRGLVLTGWRAHPNCNIVLNCAGSPRRFLRQKLQDGMRISLSELVKGPCASFVRMDGILLELHNRKEECRTWSLIATTSQVLALRLSLRQTMMSISLCLLFQIPGDLVHVYHSLPMKCTPWFTSIIELSFIVSCAPPRVVISGQDFF
jgi:hypothetical protein